MDIDAMNAEIGRLKAKVATLEAYVPMLDEMRAEFEAYRARKKEAESRVEPENE
jgi:hypothetical protein